MAYAESSPCGKRKQLNFWRASKVIDLDVTLLANGFFWKSIFIDQATPTGTRPLELHPQMPPAGLSPTQVHTTERGASFNMVQCRKQLDGSVST